MGIVDWNQIKAWRQVHEGHDVMRGGQSLVVDVGPHTRRSRRILIILLCHDCNEQIVIDEADSPPQPASEGDIAYRNGFRYAA